jgi:hypothetical protein
MCKLLRWLDHAGWMLAFVTLCAIYATQVVRATGLQAVRAAAADQSTRELAERGGWICPIAGRCGPPGTPGLGRW